MAVRKLKNYVNGKWLYPRDGNYIDVENPSTGEIIAQSPMSTTEETNEAIAAARLAFAEWSNTPVARRTKFMYRLTELIRENEEKVARQLTEEMGKSLPDAFA
jgi:malonate-semialdehyde dehydrogenase (acetylating)/methylmalonate-semialdehyde dehydrogenase